MKIGIDCRMWNETGVGRYIRNFVGGIASIDTKNEYVLFFYEIPDNLKFPNNYSIQKVSIKWHSFKEQLILPIIFLKHNLDLLHVPYFNVPILYPKKFLVTIHDLTLLRVKTGRATTLPYLYYLFKRLAFKKVLFVAIKKSKVIFTVSEFVKNDIAKTYKVSKDRIIITPNAVSREFVKKDEFEIKNVLAKYFVSRPYLFYVGNAHPHKNLEKLIEAFEIVSKQNLDINLVLGGKKYFFYERLESECKSFHYFNKLKFIGYIDDADLPALYSGAEAFVDPSLYEGFGIQILESFACGTKVVCSKTTALPEIGKDAAYYFDPNDSSDIARVIIEALMDNDNKKRSLGYQRVNNFSWTKTSQIILDIYNSKK